MFTLQLPSAGWAGGDLSHSVMGDQGLQLGPRAVGVDRAWVWGGGGGRFLAELWVSTSSGTCSTAEMY